MNEACEAWPPKHQKLVWSLLGLRGVGFDLGWGSGRKVDYATLPLLELPALNHSRP